MLSAQLTLRIALSESPSHPVTYEAPEVVNPEDVYLYYVNKTLKDGGIVLLENYNITNLVIEDDENVVYVIFTHPEHSSEYNIDDIIKEFNRISIFKINWNI